MHLHVVSALPTRGAPHAILCLWQNRHAGAGLRRARRFVDGNLNTPCPALGLGTIVDCICGTVDVDVTVSRRSMVDVGVPVSDDESDGDSGVELRALGEYESGAGIDRDGCLCSRMSVTKHT
jgi:hypothetical protein